MRSGPSTRTTACVTRRQVNWCGGPSGTVANGTFIGITTNFSFLRGGSDPRAYVHEASRLGIPVIGIADHNTLAGVVRAWNELDNPAVVNKPKLLIGARLVFIDGTPDILVYPRDRAAYGRLCQLLTRGKRGDDTDKIAKGEC